MESSGFDSIWEKRYRDNQNYRSWYPWTSIVSFIFGHAQKDRPRSEIRILEIGCGTGNNIWFVAREGFQAAGVDASETAVEFARQRLANEGLTAQLEIADFTQRLPFSDASFDLVFERAALSFTNRPGGVACVDEVRRVLKPGGVFQCSPYSDRDSSFYRNPDEDGAVRDINVGTILGGSQTCFYSIAEIRNLFRDSWQIQSLKHIEEMDMALPQRISHCEWLVMAKKI